MKENKNFSIVYEEDFHLLKNDVNIQLTKIKKGYFIKKIMGALDDKN